MASSRLVRWLLYSIAFVFAGGVLLTVAIMAFVFSIGTAVVTLDVIATVRQKETAQPVDGCVLAFEKHQLSGWGQTNEPTNRDGKSRHRVTYSYGGSILIPWDRDRDPKLKFYFGAAPRFDTPDEVETWVVHLPFDEPWFDRRVSPRTRVERMMAFEDTTIGGTNRPAGSRALPDGDANVAPIVITLGRDSGGFPVYEIPLEISLDAAQIRSCVPTAG